jgi:hypothetical protein
MAVYISKHHQADKFAPQNIYPSFTNHCKAERKKEGELGIG